MQCLGILDSATKIKAIDEFSRALKVAFICQRYENSTQERFTTERPKEDLDLEVFDCLFLSFKTRLRKKRRVCNHAALDHILSSLLEKEAANVKREINILRIVAASKALEK